MFKKIMFLSTLVGFGFLLGAISGAIASEMTPKHDMSTAPQNTEFQRIDQPLANKIAVTLGGLGLMGLEVWWFLLSKPKSQKIKSHSGIQEAESASPIAKDISPIDTPEPPLNTKSQKRGNG